MPRLLIVEDNLDLANMVRAMLEAEGHSVQVCPCGRSGMNSISTTPFDLVILDWDLPEISGISILKHFRDIGARTPVIMLTGKDSVESKEQGLDSGADDYLTKPFSMAELGARVRSQLRRATGAVKDTLSLGAITIDLANGRASRAGKTHALTSAEFELLKLAARYPHLTWQPTDLIKTVWPEESCEGDDKLRSAVRRLRKKLDSEGLLIFPGLLQDSAQTDIGQQNSQSNWLALECLPDGNIDYHLGTIIDGRYEVLEFIGGGGSGLVYKAKHCDLGHLVALKILHLAALSQIDIVQRFEREARLAASLNHPNLVTVRDSGITAMNQPFIIMDLIQGVSLGELLLAENKPAVQEVLNIFLQVARALEYLGEHGLVHRDIKPSNIMLGTSPKGIQVKLVDLGMTRPQLIDSEASKVTKTGTVLGSPSYMSPEQCRGESVDCRSDIYSFGCSLYEALEGKKPFDGKDPVEIILKHITQEPPHLYADCGNPMLSWHMAEIVKRCLARKKAERFQSAGELAKELSACIMEQSPNAIATPPTTVEQSWQAVKRNVIAWLSDLVKRENQTS